MIEKLFQLAFNKAQSSSSGKSHSKIVDYLVQQIEDITKLKFEERNVRRYYSELKKKSAIDQTPSSALVKGLSMYLGYRNYADFIKNNSVGAKTQLSFNSPWINSDSMLYDQIINIINDPFDFNKSVSSIIDTLFSGLEKSSDNSFYDYQQIDADKNSFDFGFMLIYTENLDFDLLLWNLEQALTTLTEQEKKPWTLYVISNSLLSKDQSDRIGEIIEVWSIKNQEIEYLNFYDFSDFIDQAIELLISEVHSIFIDQNEDYKDRISRIMDKDIYMDDVPFHVEGVIESQDPFNYITEEVLSSIEADKMFESHVLLTANKKSSIRSTSLNFLVSEFGYGKTTLLLQLASRLPELFDIIFVPIAQLDEKCFDSYEAFIQELYSVVIKRKFNSKDVMELLWFKAFSSYLKNRQSVFLFFDGLDEHSFAYNLFGLRKIFDCLEYLDVDCIVSVREEFWKEHKGNLDTLFSNFNKLGATIHLDEWDGSLVDQFKEEYLKQVQFDENSISIDSNFQDNFENLYSEIPKRPLFLNMIMRDLLQGNVQQRTLKELYQSYLIEKFVRDRDGVFRDILISRPLGIEENYDRYFIIGLLWNILKDVAGSMILIKDKELVLKSNVSDKILNTIIKKHENLVSLREIILNTVLIPLTYRNFDGITLHFAHKSFQEYYTALYLLEEETILQSDIFVPGGIKKFM